ncbi:MAG TPA: NADH-quinone oxidoreductase subunit K [Nitrosopumilaceae archaeon]|nr:NADH-quinone oxidoreductase subunit K [Nitrosopumilaceae archaeon]
METIQLDILTISGAILLISTFGIVVRRGFLDWLNAYRYQSIVLSGVTAIIGYVTGIWEIYIAAGMTLIIKSIIIPKVLTYVTRKLEIEFKLETNPYISIRASVIISALLVALSYFLTQQIPFKSDQIVNVYLPVSMAQFFIGLFVLVNRRTVLNQVVGLLIIENGLFLFTLALTHGVSLLIEVGIFVDILVGIVISSILLFRISRTFDSLDVGKLENLRDD